MIVSDESLKHTESRLRQQFGLSLEEAKEYLKVSIERKIRRQFGKTIKEAEPHEIYYALSRTILDYSIENWYNTTRKYNEKQVKQVYYFSAEFLMGRYMGNNLINLQIYDEIKEVLKDLDIDINIIEDSEPDPGLGNGGLGRLAACFLDSLATLKMPGHGYGIRYKYGMFQQKIENGYQMEYPDDWLKYGDPWSIKRLDRVYDIKFGGEVEVHKDEVGKEYYKRMNTETINAIAYDAPILGYGTETVNTLRLWEAKSPQGFDLQLFNDQKYLEASASAVKAEDLSRVLYPNDTERSGKELRLKQQYFFVSASLQDIVRKYKEKYGNVFSGFADKIAIQLNDTHPVVAIPELMRIFLDSEKISWVEAWEICQKVFSYTNHTVLAEALEKWDISIFSSLLPRIYQIIEEINRRFMTEISKKYPEDWAKQQRMSIIGNGEVRMAWLAIVGTHAINGVAAIHTEILKHQTLKDWYELYPEKFQNKTNGVTQRRWLLKANPELAEYITSLIGNGWITDLSELKKLEEYIEDDNVLNKLLDIKHKKKQDLAEYIKENNNIEVNIDSIFDVQVKRLHEYKRQLLNVFHIMDLYNKIKVIFIEDYKVSLAEKIIPASEVSEQISTAGKEASGTGNMKLMMNGAMTLGTLDGANIEIVEEAGEENNFIFGLKADEVERLNLYGKSNPLEEYHVVEGLKKVIDQLIDGTYYDNHRGLFKELHASLLNGVEGGKPDQYYVLKDFASYRATQSRLQTTYKDKRKWAQMMLMNIANSGKFSSDRTIKEYAKDIWNISSFE